MIELNNSRFILVLAEDPTALPRLAAEIADRGRHRQDGSRHIAAKIVKKRLVFVYGIAPYVESDSVARVLAMLKGHVPKLLAANPN